jgi:hypothetical protein
MASRLYIVTFVGIVVMIGIIISIISHINGKRKALRSSHKHLFFGQYGVIANKPVG